MPETKDTVVLGAGSWGTTIANHLAKKKHKVRLWSPFPEELAEITESHVRARLLPGIDLETSLKTEKSLPQALAGAEHIFLAVPGRFFMQTIEEASVKSALESGVTLINASKGLSANTKDANQPLFASEAFQQTIGTLDNYINLTGPTFAKELALERFSALLVSGSDADRVKEVCLMLETRYLKTTAGQDIVGAEIGGVFKNAYAVLTGACAGLGFGANTYSAVVTECLHEMMSFGCRQGAQSETFAGLSGVGDLVLTTGSEQSRNYRLGFLLAQGKTIAQAQEEIGQETEGYYTALVVENLANRFSFDFRILLGIHKMLTQGYAVGDLIADVFSSQQG